MIPLKSDLAGLDLASCQVLLEDEKKEKLPRADAAGLWTVRRCSEAKSSYGVLNPVLFLMLSLDPTVTSSEVISPWTRTKQADLCVIYFSSFPSLFETWSKITM